LRILKRCWLSVLGDILSKAKDPELTRLRVILSKAKDPELLRHRCRRSPVLARSLPIPGSLAVARDDRL